MIAVAAVSGAMAVTMPVTAAFAAGGSSAADGESAGSPGVGSGNTIQLPVHVPVNVCGNTVNVVGLLNPAAGNTCVNDGGEDTPAPPGAAAQGSGKDSPGVVSGNGVQLPVHLPVNVTGNTVSVVGIGNAATGNESVNTPGDEPQDTPVKPEPKPDAAPPKPHHGPEAPLPEPRQPVASLARTGADQTLPALAGSAALLLGGAALVRRFRPRTER
ncbi:chaplin [Streptomyces sp. S.PB5]|uniref:chaplin n=1 Tax=Streptomyces sp. S.PB5 TaxID=3020844 RepID=UPI0025B0C301|nr:chaplin [Streptomyces sp. S.PB5]MDN3024269.1 chaplin [Streptomyces sp. S.PB5]